MKTKKKCRFINLAEQLSIQNEIVSSTMDRMLAKAANSKEARDRSDWDEIKKCLEQLHEFNGPATPAEPTPTSVPRPKYVARSTHREGQHTN